MDSFEKSKFWLIGITILAILNIGLLAFIWYDHLGRPAGMPPTGREFEGKDPGNLMAKELGFDEEQTRILRQLNLRQRTESDSIKAVINRLDAQMVDELFVAEPDSALIRKLSENIGAEHAELERRLFYHFLAIKKMCNAIQQEKLQQLITEVMKRSLCPPPPDRVGDGFPPGPPGDLPPESSRRDPPPPNGERQLPPGH
jgi:hypothetical protein